MPQNEKQFCIQGNLLTNVMPFSIGQKVHTRNNNRQYYYPEWLRVEAVGADWVVFRDDGEKVHLCSDVEEIFYEGAMRYEGDED